MTDLEKQIRRKNWEIKKQKIILKSKQLVSPITRGIEDIRYRYEKRKETRLKEEAKRKELKHKKNELESKFNKYLPLYSPEKIGFYESYNHYQNGVKEEIQIVHTDHGPLQHKVSTTKDNRFESFEGFILTENNKGKKHYQYVYAEATFNAGLFYLGYTNEEFLCGRRENGKFIIQPHETTWNGQHIHNPDKYLFLYASVNTLFYKIAKNFESSLKGSKILTNKPDLADEKQEKTK